jgi:hypothetical protein
VAKIFRRIRIPEAVRKGSARLTGKKVARQKLRETAESSRRCDDKILAGSQLTGTAVPVTHTHTDPRTGTAYKKPMLPLVDG